MSSLSFDEAQKLVDNWISKFEEGYFPPLVQLARLIEELGELSRAISHQTGVKIPKQNENIHSVEEEFGDLLFLMTCFANAQKISMNDAFTQALNKIESRDTSRWTLKKGIHQ